MADTIEGVVLFGEFEKDDSFNYVNPTTNQSKLLRSVKMLLPHGDGTVTRESLSVPDNYELPKLQPTSVYGFPVVASVSRKSGKLSFTLRHDLKPFPAPTLE